MRLRAAILLATLALAVSAGAAQAQYTITSEQGAVDREMACRKGQPADADDIAKAHTRIEATMQQFFALNASSKPGGFENLLDSDNPTFRDASGAVPLAQIGAHMPPSAPQRTLVAMVVGGDAQTARAVWSADGGVYYAADFVNHGWLGGWKLWHVTVSATKPPMPPAYCHFDNDRSY